MKRNNLDELINIIKKGNFNPEEGLPEELFLFVSSIMPLVNVDLLIKDETDRVLLSWRDDEFTGIGWHLPGGILRFKDSLEKRIQIVAQEELCYFESMHPKLIQFDQNISPHNFDIRSHFISFLFDCQISSSFIPINKNLKYKEPGYVMWHKKCPEDLIECQNNYRKFI